MQIEQNSLLGLIQRNGVCWMKEAIIFGAGRVGRGFLAEVYQQAGYAICFVERNINLVDQLNKRGQYTIHKAYGALTDTVTIRDVRALHTTEQGSIVDLLSDPQTAIALAVSPYKMQDTADFLAMAIARRTLENPDAPMDILLCTNSAEPAERLNNSLHEILGGTAQQYLMEQVGLVRTIVMRVFSDEMPEEASITDPLALLNNGYPEMPVDAKAFKAAPPNSPILRLTQDFDAEFARQTFTFNMAQAATAYLGTPLNLTTVPAALSHPRVYPYVQQALEESAHGLCGEYKFARMQMTTWNEEILAAFKNTAVAESLLKCGIDTARKVGVIERLVGAALLCQKYDRPPYALARIIAHAYLYKGDDPGTRRLQDAVSNDGIELALERYSMLDFRSPLRTMVLDEYERAKAIIGGEY